jgi:uncharacterized protein YjbI with pentapeptide repeats
VGKTPAEITQFPAPSAGREATDMDRDEALRLLKSGPEGVKEWNRRRKAREAIPNLSVANLSDANLSDANLSVANLRGADLCGANLCGANLRGANLIDANLIDANLIDANLHGVKLIDANLSGANLSDAKLSVANLSVANLRYANLHGANLSGANLSVASLHGANLSGANLSVANLRVAHLRGANLRGANLSGADLSDANSTGADLSGADLRGAVLSRANLDGADLSNTKCNVSVFAYVDLSKVKGLDSVQHFGPSTLGTDSLILSHGQIPEVFLRGCGLTDAWITYLPSLIGSAQPIQLHSCFISYSSKDDPFARRLHGRMRQADLRVWFAPEDMKGGRFIEDQITRAISLHDKLLLVLTRGSMGSNWVRREIKKALAREKQEKRRMLFPIRLCSLKAIGEWVCLDADTGRDFAEEVRKYHILDFSGWKTEDDFEAAFGKLLDDLKADEPAGKA